MKTCIEDDSGPEALHLQLAELNQSGAPWNDAPHDLCLRQFEVSLFAEGSGTQIFSTSFVQWTMRELLRRAQPVTLLARFAPRQRQKSFNATVASALDGTDLDPNGSLIDADMAAYSAYLEMMRLSGADKSAFLVWFEGHSEVYVSSRNIAAGTESESPTTVSELLLAM
jgi:hypothetical protein